MADIASGTLATTTGKVEDGTSGGAVNATKVNAVYFDTADSKWKLAQATGAAQAGRDGVGIALNANADTGHLRVAREGRVTLAGLTQGQVYCVSPTAAGGIAPYADLGTGNYVTILGVAISATVLELDPIISGITKP